jgi:hypothetical protein
MRHGSLKALNINDPMHRQFASVAIAHVVVSRDLQIIPVLLALVYLYWAGIRFVAQQLHCRFRICHFAAFHCVLLSHPIKPSDALIAGARLARHRSLLPKERCRFLPTFFPTTYQRYVSAVRAIERPCTPLPTIDRL